MTELKDQTRRRGSSPNRGKELFYRDAAGNLRAVEVKIAPTFSVARSRALFPAAVIRYNSSELPSVGFRGKIEKNGTEDYLPRAFRGQAGGYGPALDAVRDKHVANRRLADRPRQVVFS